MTTLVRYMVVAFIAYVIDMGGYFLLLQIGTHPVSANIFVKILAALCGFFMHRYYSYQITEVNGQKIHAIKYFGLALIYTPISTLVLFIMMFIVPHPIYAKAIVDIMLFVVTFWVTSRFTFTRINSH